MKEKDSNIWMFIGVLFFIILCLLGLLGGLNSCKPYRQVQSTSKDSINIKEVYRIDTFYVQNPEDSTLIMALVECDSLNQAQMMQLIFDDEKQKVNIVIKDGKLTGKFICKADSFMALAKFHEIKHEIYKKITLNNTVTLEKKNPINKFLLWWFLSSLFVIILGIIILLFKNKLKYLNNIINNLKK